MSVGYLPENAHQGMASIKEMHNTSWKRSQLINKFVRSEHMDLKSNYFTDTSMEYSLSDSSDP